MFEEALDAAVLDFQETQKRREEQEKMKQEWEDEKERDRMERERTGEAYEEEVKEWEEVEDVPFLTVDEKYVVCLDTMGQDREYSEEERRAVLNTVKSFRDCW
jgi:prolyl oligopeptidase PreP (S9A serine peptidase family)